MQIIHIDRGGMERMRSGRTAPEYLEVQFTVEREEGGGWELVAAEVEASSHHQAVVRASTHAGIYRASLHGVTGSHQHFAVPGWGPPELLGGEEG